DVTEVVIYEAFVEGRLEAPKHLARTVHDLYFEPRYEEFRPRTIWSLSNAFTSAFKELDPIPQFKATAKLGEFLEARFSQSFSISKQGNPMMRSLLVEAGHSAARLDHELRQDYQRLKLRRGSGVAKVAIARTLAVRMYWMLRSQASYAQLVRMQGSPWATLVTQ